MREFQFKSTKEEFKIGGKVYEIDFSDKALKEYQLQMQKYKKQYEDIKKVDFENQSHEEQLKSYDEAFNLVKESVNMVLGKGSFDELYKASGESLENMSQLLTFLYEIIAERLQETKEQQKSKYVK